MKRVLFVCTGNTCRSGMAEALLRARLAQAGEWPVVVESAGTTAWDGAPASGHAILVLAERGINHSAHQSRRVSADIVRQADLILTMTHGHKSAVIEQFPEAAGRTFTLKEFAGPVDGLDVADPYGGAVQVYRETLEEIERAIVSALPGILRFLGINGTEVENGENRDRL